MARQTYSEGDRVLVKTGRKWETSTVTEVAGKYVRYRPDSREEGSWSPRVYGTRAYILPLDSDEARTILNRQAEVKKRYEEEEARNNVRREAIAAHRLNDLAQRIEDEVFHDYSALSRREKLLALLDEVLPERTEW